MLGYGSFFVLYSKNRNVLLHVTKKTCIFGFSFTLSVELSWVLLRPAEVQRGLHDYARTGASLAIQGTCINPDCSSSPSTICVGCTNDVGFVFCCKPKPGKRCCCKPKPGKRCWERLHESRAPDRVDANVIAVERPSLIKKRKRNSNLGSERKPKKAEKASVPESSSYSIRIICHFIVTLNVTKLSTFFQS